MSAVVVEPLPVADGASIEAARPGGVDRPAVLVAGSAPYAIVDVNDEWLRACSYSSRQQVVGQTLSIIQGPKTEPEVVAELMEGVTARVPIIELVLTNYDARRRPFRNELTVEPVECGGGAYFLATCTITLLSRRGRRFTLRRGRVGPDVAAESAQTNTIDIPVNYERDFTADFTRLLSIPSLVEQILFCLDAPWAARASQVCHEWYHALSGPHAQQYWHHQCGRFWDVPTHQLHAVHDATDWRHLFFHLQQQGTRAPRPTAKRPLLLQNPHTNVQAMWDVASSHHTVMLNATADAAVDRSVRTDHPVFVARNDRSRSSPKSRTARQSAACGVLSRTGPTGDLLWQITPRNTAYFELTVCPPTDAIPAREPQSECVAIGFVNRSFALQGRQPGWDPSTWGYHSDDGRLYAGTGTGADFGPSFTERDTVGCGVFQCADNDNLCFFFTKNGVLLGGTSADIAAVCSRSTPSGANGPGELFACVGISTFSTCHLNFGETEFEFDLCRWENLLSTRVQRIAPPWIQSMLPMLPMPGEQSMNAGSTAGSEAASDENNALRTISQAATVMNEAGGPQSANATLTWFPGATTGRRRGRLERLLNCVGMPALVSRNGVTLGGGARGAEL